MSESPQDKTQEEGAPASEPAHERAAGSAAAPAAAPASSPARGSRWAWALVLLLIAVAGAGFGWYWYENRAERGVIQQAFTQKLAEVDAKAQKDRRIAEDVRETVSGIQDKLAALDKRVAQMQAQHAALDAQIGELTRNRDDWSLAEVEQTLEIASRQLQLTGDIAAALSTLRAAEEKLRQLSRPELKGLREAVAADVKRLQKVPVLDTASISAQLTDLADRVDRLPLAMDIRPQPAAQPAAAASADEALWQRLLRETWDELRKLVRVERMDRADIALLAPSQAFFLRENLKLRLLNARLALLARDLRSYKADIGAAREWLRQYYDGRDDAVARAIGMLTSLHAAETSAEVPDIPASLEAMRALRSAPPTAAQQKP
jgi:uroporphyrin-3 C-methyltransferase